MHVTNSIWLLQLGVFIEMEIVIYISCATLGKNWPTTAAVQDEDLNKNLIPHGVPNFFEGIHKFGSTKEAIKIGSICYDNSPHGMNS